MSGENEHPAPGSDEEQKQISAAFSAAFSDDEDSEQGASQPTETPADEQQPEASKPSDAADNAAAPAPTPAPEPKVVQITEDEWNATKSRAAKVDEIEATWSKRLDQTFGKIGGIERKLAELQKTTPEGEAVQVSEEDFAELKDAYPEIAQMQAKGLNKILSKLKVTGGDQQAVEKILGEHVDSVRAEIVKSSLEAVFPEWEDDVKTPKFAEWFKSQPADVQALAESKKLGDAARMLRSFYKAAETPAPAPAPTTAPAPAQPSTRQRQIAAAVNPKGEGSAPAPKAKSPFQEAFEEDD
jgi:hypothetical protein